MIAVGKILRPFGTDGHVKAERLSANPERIVAGSIVRIGSEERDTDEYCVENVASQAGAWRLKLSGVSTIGEAERLRDCYVYVSGEAAPLKGENEFYIHDIIGLKAVDSKGTALGEIMDVISMNHHDLWVIRCNDSEQYIPAVREYIEKVDIERGIVVVRVIEGLLGE